MQDLKVPPHALQSEQAVIGAIFLKPDIMPKVQTVLTRDDFYRDANGAIFQAMETLKKAGNVIEPSAVMVELEKAEVLEKSGGLDHIASIVQGCSTSAGWKYHADEIRSASVKRQLIASFTEAHEALFSNTPTSEILSTVKSEIIDIESSSEDIQTVHVSEVVPSVLEKIDNGIEMGVPSGFYKLDKVTMGWQAGDLIIIAGRPGMGKSVFAKDCAEHAKAPVLYFSLEMSKEQLINRQLSGISGVDHDALRGGGVERQQWQSIIDAADKLSDMPIYYNDSAKMTIGKLCAISETYKMVKKIGLVVIDYLQLILPDSRGDSREQQVSAISRSLKVLARHLEIPVICLAQLNRKVDDRKPPIPVLSDLRESGSLEQDADFVGFLYRPFMYDQNKDPTEAYFYLAKGRNTRTGKIDLLFNGSNQIFRNPSWRED